jgi:hypothetical protein
MSLRWRWFSRAEDRVEGWLTRHHQERVLAGETKPVGPCPDESFLQSLARHSNEIAFTDPRVGHAANCTICISRLLELRPAYKARRGRMVLTTAVACCCVIVVALILVARHEAIPPRPVPDEAAVQVTVDLWNAGTLRGDQPSPLQSVTLPAALAKVTIILPRYSESGRYSVAVTRDRTGNDLLAKGSATAIAARDREEVSINLDLRNSRPGSYFLSTTHEQDQASYYYPLQIK